MKAIATTCIWPVGNLQNPINYITQDKKVSPAENDNLREVSEDSFSLSEQQALLHIMSFQGQSSDRKKLENVLGYAVQEKKTTQYDGSRFVTGINCSAQSALTEMLLTKKQFGKTNGIACYHGYQSFVPGEVTPELAHTIGVELAKRLWGDRFQVIVATHLDREHLHNHFVLNSVSFTDGKKFRNDFHDYDRIRVMSDKLCKEYSLSIVKAPQVGRIPNPKVYEELGMERPTPIYEKIKVDVDMAIAHSSSLSEFYSILQNMGYSFRTGNLKYFTIQAPGASRSTRLEKKLGQEYSLERITQRISQKAEDLSGTSKMEYDTNCPSHSHKPQLRYRGTYAHNTKHSNKKTHFQRLYLYYCYRFGVFKSKQYGRYTYSQSEVRRMRNLSAETRLLITNHIDSSDELRNYQNGLLSSLDFEIRQRKQMYNKLRSADAKKSQLIQEQIEKTSSTIKSLRYQIKICNQIWKRMERQRISESITDTSDDYYELKEGAIENDRTGCSKSGSKPEYSISR